LDQSLHVLKPRSFFQNRAPKMRERHQLFFGLRFVSKEFQHPAIKTKTEQRMRMQTVIQTSRRMDSFLHEAAQNFEIF
jgi:hypothetical protein